MGRSGLGCKDYILYIYLLMHMYVCTHICLRATKEGCTPEYLFVFIFHKTPHPVCYVSQESEYCIYVRPGVLPFVIKGRKCSF